MTILHNFRFSAESQASILQSPAGDSSLCTRDPKEHRRNCVSGFFIGDRAHASSVKHFNRSKADRRPARRRIIERRPFQRAEGWIARRGDFSLPAFVCFLWSFLCTSKESGVPEIIKRTIKNPANPQICWRRAMRKKRIATSLRSSQ